MPSMNAEGVKILHHDVFSNGIAYLDLLFDIGRVAREDIPYLGVLKAVLGMVNTEHYTYQELNNEINRQHRRHFRADIRHCIRKKRRKCDPGSLRGIRASVLYEKLPLCISRWPKRLRCTHKFDG